MKRRKCVLARNAVISTIILACILFFWTHALEEEVRYMPDYPMEDISIYLKQDGLTEEEYDILFRQTGMSSVAVDALCKMNRSEELFALQERFFAEVETTCECNFPMFREILVQPHKTVSASGASSFVPVLEDGDILITFNSHFLGWRNGHAAIVIDAEKGLTLEALAWGRDSDILSVDNWIARPSFVVLRMTKLSKEQRAEVAGYAEENLARIPYQLTAGLWGSSLSGTNCSHLVWYAYNQFGYDLDSDDGFIVTPKDIYQSPLLEVVQMYGMKP